MVLVALAHWSAQAPWQCALTGRERAVAAPDHELALVAGAARDWQARSFALVPHGDSAPHPVRPLNRVGERRELPPVGEYREHAAVLHHAATLGEPVRAPRHPRSLVLAVAGEWEPGDLPALVLVVDGLGAVAAELAAAGVWRVGDQGVYGCGGQGPNEWERVAEVQCVHEGMVSDLG